MFATRGRSSFFFVGRWRTLLSLATNHGKHTTIKSDKLTICYIYTKGFESLQWTKRVLKNPSLISGVDKYYFVDLWLFE